MKGRKLLIYIFSDVCDPPNAEHQFFHLSPKTSFAQKPLVPLFLFESNMSFELEKKWKHTPKPQQKHTTNTKNQKKITQKKTQKKTQKIKSPNIRKNALSLSGFLQVLSLSSALDAFAYAAAVGALPAGKWRQALGLLKEMYLGAKRFGAD